MKKETIKQISQTSEEDGQIMIFEWAEIQQGKWPELRLMYHVPNEGKRSKTTGAILKKAGLKNGVPDICLPVPKGTYHGLYIEFKSLSGKATAEQKGWIVALEAQGYKTKICYGFDEAIEEIKAYLNLGPFSPEKLMEIYLDMSQVNRKVVEGKPL